MDRDVRNRGRKKRVTTGSGSVRRRGKASGGKVGSSGGFADRKSASASGGTQPGGQRASGLAGLFGSSSGGSGSKKKGFSWKTILIIVIVVVAGYLIYTYVLAPGDSGSSLGQGGSGFTPVMQDGNTPALNTTVADEARDKRTVIKGGGNDVFTIMIYMCASDLESKYAMATKDLQEILAADIGENVNIIVETGGAKTWQNDVIDSSTNRRYQCTSDGLRLLQDNLGRKEMTDPATLADFIQYCKTNFPANRYGLILWDHGGGSNSGYGYDEFHPGASMKLGEINEALRNAGTAFDFVGFDACLMATFETAMMLDQYADYMIASEETEPGIGWYYTGWISALSANTSMSTPEIGKRIIDDFIAACSQQSPNDKMTLSIVDLAELSGTVPDKFRAFATSTAALIDSDDYQTVASARSGTREFGPSSDYNQIDLVHLAQNLGTSEGAALADALKQSVKYNRTGRGITNANGLSIYFPFGKLSTLGPMLDTYEDIGMDEQYSECIKRFANLEAGGQIVTSGSESPVQSLLGQLGGSSSGGGIELVTSLLGSFIDSGDFSSITGDATNWLDGDKLMDSAQYLADNYLDASKIVLTQKDGRQVLSLSDEDWGLVQTISLGVFLDDGEGYIDLGLNNVYSFAENNLDMIADFDGTWPAINGQVVCYYLVSEEEDGDDYIITGRVPAMRNGERVDLILVFNNENEFGVVAGARPMYSEDETLTAAKGLIPIEDGDVIDFLCDFYTYDEAYDDSYYLGEQLVVDGELEISNVSVGDASCLFAYRLTDIYDNTYWTPAQEYLP